MDTKSVTTADFIRHFGRYHDEARRKPITLTKQGRASLVVMSSDAYEALTARAEDPRRVYGPGETPPDLAAIIGPELDRLIAEGSAADER